VASNSQNGVVISEMDIAKQIKVAKVWKGGKLKNVCGSLRLL